MQKYLSLAGVIVSLASTLPAQAMPIVAQSSHVGASADGERLSSRPLDAIPSSPAATQAAREFRQSRVSGRALAKRVKRLEALGWHESLDEVRRAAEESGKPIFWIQLLGDLDGYT